MLAAVSAAGGRRWRWILPPLLALLALTCALAALARPEVRMSVASEQASIALTIDVSGSMSADDVKPTRLGAAQEAVRRFLAGLPDKYRVGLVTFSSEPYVAAPLTHDRKLVLEGLLLGDTSFGQGTAIGDALARSVEMLVPVTGEGEAVPGGGTAPPPPPDPDRPLSAILLLSDGAQTRGALAPLQGAARAKSYGIPVYTVALGTPEGVLESRRVLPARAARPRHIAADRPGDRRRVLRHPERGPSQRGLRGSRLPARAHERVARAELRTGRGGGAAGAGRRRALAAVEPAAAVRGVLLTAVAMAGLVAAGCGDQSSKSVTTVVTVTRTTTTAASPSTSTSAPRGASTADVVARVLPGVVNVRTVGFNGNQGEGSGVVIDRRGVTSWLDDPEAIAEQYASEDALRERVLAHRELVVGPDDEEIVRERILQARPRRLLEVGSGLAELCGWAKSRLDGEVVAVDSVAADGRAGRGSGGERRAGRHASPTAPRRQFRLRRRELRPSTTSPIPKRRSRSWRVYSRPAGR